MLGRRSSGPAAEVVEPEPEETVDSGKGRPTPKRSDARKARRNATPRTRKEAAAIRRERLRTERAKARQALATGDERNLPPRDAGVEKRLARDVVDSRFTAGQALFGLLFVSLVLSLVKASVVNLIATLLVILIFIGLIVDGYRNGRRAKQAVAERFGADRTVGIAGYAMSRALLPRRFRKPPPKVNRGDAVRS
jgi:hypothetical protein